MAIWQQIHQNANRAAALVGQLLAFSRKQTLKPEQIHLAVHELTRCHASAQATGRRKGPASILHPADNLGPIRADRRQLEQVLINLVVNARDAMPNGRGNTHLRSRPNADLAEDHAAAGVSACAGTMSSIRVMPTKVRASPT
jgi:two-component system, cell cycle sensor histidine kinase and response regulator CckA